MHSTSTKPRSKTNAKAKAARQTRKADNRIKLHTWDEVEQYKAKHLKPKGYGPKGRPIYDFEEVCKLNIKYPDEP